MNIYQSPPGYLWYASVIQSLVGFWLAACSQPVQKTLAGLLELPLSFSIYGGIFNQPLPPFLFLIQFWLNLAKTTNPKEENLKSFYWSAFFKYLPLPLPHMTPLNFLPRAHFHRPKWCPSLLLWFPPGALPTRAHALRARAKTFLTGLKFSLDVQKLNIED